MEPEISPEQAAFFEQKTREYLMYTIECLDLSRKEGNNVLQWLFAVITGGIGFAGTLATKNYDAIAMGVILAVLAASYAVVNLITELRSRDTAPPGNFAASLNQMLDEPIGRMRWREACGVDRSIKTNLKHAESLATAVDLARTRFARLPLWFIGGTALAYATNFHF